RHRRNGRRSGRPPRGNAVTRAPGWARALLWLVAPPGAVDDVLGDLEEAHRLRRLQHAPLAARALSGIDTLDMALALVRARVDRLANSRGSLVQDYKLG